MSKTIAVVGVTGNQGGSVARTFLKKSWVVRGITRNVSSAAAQALSAQGITIVAADLDDPSSLVPAFSGAHVIFALTDFWAPYFAAFAELSKVSDRATAEHAIKIEIRRGKNLVDAAAAVLPEGTLERFVLSTLPDFKKQSKRKCDFNYHYDGKALVSEYLKSKTALWAKSSLLNVGFYTTNMVTYGMLHSKNREKNGGKFVLRNAGSPTALHPFFVPDDTGLFVDLLVRAPPGQDLLGVSEFASYETFIKLWSEVTGVPSEAQEITVEDADKASPGGIGREAAESNATSAEFGWGDHLVLPTDLDPKLQTTSLKDFMMKEDWTEFLKII